MKLSELIWKNRKAVLHAVTSKLQTLGHWTYNPAFYLDNQPQTRQKHFPSLPQCPDSQSYISDNQPQTKQIHFPSLPQCADSGDWGWPQRTKVKPTNHKPDRNISNPYLNVQTLVVGVGHKEPEVLFPARLSGGSTDNALLGCLPQCQKSEGGRLCQCLLTALPQKKQHSRMNKQKNANTKKSHHNVVKYNSN